MHAAGFVLAGGQSRRMGRDKAMLPWGSGVLLEDVAKRVAVAAGNVAVVGDPAAYGHLGIECLADLHPGLGPLSGIEAALASNRGTCNLIVACDMPGLPVEHLRALLRAAREGVSRCVVTIDGAEKIHPLCAVYFDNCLPEVERALEENRLRLLDLVQQLNPAVVRCSQPLVNVNSMEDWSAAV